MTTVLDFFLELAAVFLGVLGAFELDNYREAKAEDKERVRLLGLISREVDSNNGILIGMSREEDAAFGVPNARPMRNIWDGITSKLAILRNDELLEEATMLYWDLANLDGMLDIYRDYAGRYQYASSEEKVRLGPILFIHRTHYVDYIKNEALPQITIVRKLIDAELWREKSNHVPKSNTEDEKTAVQ